MFAFFVGIISGVAAAALVAWWRVHKKHRELLAEKRDKEAIVFEERRMFDFLHGLGATLALEGSSSSLHRLIVEGAVEVAGGLGGSLYVLSPSGEQLVPSVYSKDCPPVIELPERIEERARTNPNTLGSFLRLHSIARDEGLVGEVLESGQPLMLGQLCEHPSFSRDRAHPYQRNVTVMAAPLSHLGEPAGVLLVAADSRERTFSENDFDVFSSVAEQSSFALGNHRIHEEAREKHRLEEELRNASEIQRVLLPDTAPELEDYDFAAVNLPAKVVSGDYYDYVPIDDDHYGIAIGDVSGKGIAASLVAAMSRSVLRANATGNHSPSAVLAEVNRLAFPDIREDMFVSLAYLVLDRLSDTVRLARAGHPAVLHHVVAEGRIIEHKPPGMAVGLDRGGVFERVVSDGEFTMAPGDCLLLYTDGVTEATDAKGLEYGRPRMEKVLLEAAREGGCETVVAALRRDLEAFSGGAGQGDDITLIAIEKRGNSPSPNPEGP